MLQSRNSSFITRAKKRLRETKSFGFNAINNE